MPSVNSFSLELSRTSKSSRRKRPSKSGAVRAAFRRERAAAPRDSSPTADDVACSLFSGLQT